MFVIKSSTVDEVLVVKLPHLWEPRTLSDAY